MPAGEDSLDREISRQQIGKSEEKSGRTAGEEMGDNKIQEWPGIKGGIRENKARHKMRLVRGFS